MKDNPELFKCKNYPLPDLPVLTQQQIDELRNVNPEEKRRWLLGEWKCERPDEKES